MFRKLLLSGVTALSAAAPLSLTPAAQAQIIYPPPVVIVQPRPHVYRVLYRRFNGEPLALYGRYHRWSEAERAAIRLRANGFVAHIR